MKKSIVPGSKVVMHFSLSLEDGTEAISTFAEEPFGFTMGDGSLQPGLELALYGLQTGDRQTLTLDPDQAYGFHHENMIHDMPHGDFPAGLEPEPGQIMGFQAPNGEETPGMILEVNNDRVKVDFNHPLAGRRVVYKVQILEVENS